MRVMMRNQNFTHCAANAMGFCEWQAAGLAYFRALRAAGATLRGKRAAGCDFAFRFLASQVRAIGHLAKAVAHEGGPRRE